MGDEVRESIYAMTDWLVEIRRTLHMHPELMYEEEKTAELVAANLGKFGLEVKTGVAKTGVVGLLRGAKPGKTVAIRADMDALPIEEANPVPYASKIPGKMHACGHDAHTTILLGVAKYFSARKDLLRGNIKWIFQPAEEGGAGGKLMAEEGVLENPKVDAIFGAHVFPEIPIGKIGVNEKEGLAATDRVTFKIVGKGAHGAYPHLSRDPILAAGHLITQIHSIVSRSIPPLDSAVISFGKIEGGTAFNIIPGAVNLLATVRSLTPKVRETLKERMEQVAEGVGRSFGLECRCQYDYGYPALVNDPEMARLVASACGKAIGKENVAFLQPSMGGEDFAYFLERVPGAFFRLGCRNEAKGFANPFHNSLFDLDEDVLPFGVEMFVRIIDSYLGLELTKEKAV